MRNPAKELVKYAVRRTGAQFPGDSLAQDVAQLLRAHDVDVVVDVGAHLGEYGRMLRLNGYEGTIVSFEPNPEVRASLDQIASRDRNWIVDPRALSDTRGEATLHVFERSELASLLEPGNEMSLGTAREVPVQSERLDVALAEHISGLEQKSLFVKTDAQGADLQVLSGSAGIMTHVQGLQCEAAITERYDGGAQLRTILDQSAEWGFHTSGIYPVLRDQQGRLLEVDCLFTR